MDRSGEGAMKTSSKLRQLELLGVLGLALMATGCQIDSNGQTLPSPYYLDDDVQYFPAGPEFKLTREAAAMENMQRGAVLRGAPPVMPAPSAGQPGMPMGVPAPAPAPGGEAVPPPAANM
jgi:hypothetical protein